MEVKIPILKRVPPGDRWTLIEGDGREVYPTLTAGIEAIFRLNGSKRYMIDAGEGKVYFIEEREDSPEVKQSFSIYGDM